MKKMLTFICVFLLLGVFLIPKIYPNRLKDIHSGSFAYVPPSLCKPVEMLLAYPPAKKLLAHLEKRGPIQITFSHLGPQGANAMWRDDTRQIVINASKKRGAPDYIRSILFEMHNANSRDRFSIIDHMARTGRITKQDYIRKIESMEHENALKVKRLVDSAISEGYFPKETAWNIIENFEEHYKFQQKTGHSQFIAAVYDSLSSSDKANA